MYPDSAMLRYQPESQRASGVTRLAMSCDQVGAPRYHGTILSETSATAQIQTSQTTPRRTARRTSVARAGGAPTLPAEVAIVFSVPIVATIRDPAT
jgi:hypothetical protein